MFKKIIISLLIISTVLLVLFIYLNINNKSNESQKNIYGAIIKIPNKEGFEAKMTNIKGNNLRGDIKDSQTGKKSSGEVIAYVDKKINLSDDGSSFILPFELDYGRQERYLYLGAFYFEFDNPSILNKADSPKTLKHPYSYFLGKNITLEKIGLFVPGSYSYIINLEYLNNEGVKSELALRFYYEHAAFEIAKNCEEIGSIVKREKSDGKSYDVCVFDEKHECTLDAYEKGNCPVKGYDISVTENPIEKWGIAQGFLFRNGKFIFRSDFEHCIIDDFYFGRCDISGK